MIAFDHLVIFSNDPKRHQELFSSVYEQQAFPGGRHANWGTFNHLAFMKNDCYVEWLGIEDVAKAQQSNNPLIQHSCYAYEHQIEGPIQFALRIDDMDFYQKRFDELDLPYEGPFPGRRTKPDGTVLEWKMLFPKYEFDQSSIPFLIEWTGQMNKPNHPEEINDTSFQTMTILDENIDHYVQNFSRIYNLEANKVSNYEYQFDLSNGKLAVKYGKGLKAKFENIYFNTV